MEKTLVVLAAGMSSRFGSLKQIRPIGPSGEFLIDYSVYDAIKSGFTKVVFVVRRETKQAFEETIGNRVSNFIKVAYAYQEFDTLKGDIPSSRVKPLGTAHALLCAKKYIEGPFALISADDYYGPNAFKLLANYLDNEIGIGVIGYNTSETIPANSEVKRGVIIENNGTIESIIESKVTKDSSQVYATPLDGGKPFTQSLDGYASMLIYGFSNNIFELLESEYANFLKNADLEKDEFLLTYPVDKCIKEGYVKLIKTQDKWIGMTYKEDEQMVIEKINTLIEKGVYKNNLWS